MAADEWEPEVTNLEDEEGEEVEWVWPRRFPKGKVTLVSGDGGVGKTHAVASVVTSVLRREDFSDGEVSGEEPGHVLIVTTESSGGELRRIFVAQGCEAEDLRYIHKVGHILKKGSKERYSFDIDRNIVELEKLIKKWKPIILIFDPLVEFHSRREIDSHQVRGLMVKLNDLCERYRMTIIAMIHWNKNEKLTAHNRTSGSHQYSAGVKSVVIIASDPKIPELKHFTQDKHNLGPKPVPLAFKIDEPDGLVLWSKVEGISPVSKVEEAEEVPKELSNANSGSSKRKPFCRANSTTSKE